MTDNDRTVNLSITLHEDENGTPEGMSFNTESHGVDGGGVVTLLVQAVIATQQQIFADEFEKAYPLGDREMLTALAQLNARLRVMDEVVHQPFTQQAGVWLDIE